MVSAKHPAPLHRILVALAAVAIFPLASRLVPGWLTGSDARVVLHALVQIALALGVMIYVLAVERVPAAQLGVRRLSGGTLLWGVLAAIAIIISGALVMALTLRLGSTATATLELLARRPVPILLLMAFMAGLSEEIVFRAVLIEHIGALTGRVWIGALGSIVLFAAMHASKWGPLHVLATLPPAVILAGFFLWRRDLGACILAHFLTDAVGLISYSLQHAGH